MSHFFQPVAHLLPTAFIKRGSLCLTPSRLLFLLLLYTQCSLGKKVSRQMGLEQPMAPQTNLPQ